MKRQNPSHGQFLSQICFLGMLGAILVLASCANVGAEILVTTPTPPSQSEPPAQSGNTVSPTDGAMTPNSQPEATATTPIGTGEDEPVSSKPGAPSETAPAPADSQRVSRPQITGHITDQAQQPIADAIVLITQGTAEYPERTYLSDAQGKYTIPVPPGTFRVAVNAEGYEFAEQEVEVTANGESVLNFELTRE